MTTPLRGLAHSVHLSEPTDVPANKTAHDEWWIEQIIGWAHDHDEPTMLDCLRWLRPDLTSNQIGERVTELLDLADEIACPATRSDRWHTAVDAYAALLTRFATGPTFSEQVDLALAIQDTPIPAPTDELAARRLRS